MRRVLVVLPVQSYHPVAMGLYLDIFDSVCMHSQVPLHDPIPKPRIDANITCFT